MIISRARVFSDRTASGSVTGTGSVAIPTSGAGTVSVGVTGTWTGNLGFEATVDGVNWLPVDATQILPTGTSEDNTSVNGNWSLNVAGFNSFRVKGQPVSTGAANVYLDASQATGPTSFPNPLPVTVVGSGSTPITVNHNEVSLIPSGVESTLITLTASSVPLNIVAVNVSGENVALYRVKINGLTVFNKRSWWGAFNQTFEFPQNGMVLNVGQTMTVTALHNRLTLSNFEATVLSN